jgi:uncharacterized protein (DUF58 family)
MVFLTREFTFLIGIVVFFFLLFSKTRSKEDFNRELSIERKVSGKRFQENDQIKVTLTITNTSNKIFRGEIFDTLPENTSIWEGSNLFILLIPPGEIKIFSYNVSFRTRGKYILGPIKIRYHSEGEVFHDVWVYDSIKQVVIIPYPEPVTQYTIPPDFLTKLGGLFKSKLVGDGMEFAGVREYRRGDTLRRINWKHTARYRVLHSNEYELNRATNIILVLDLTEESKDIADASVRSALGMAKFLSNYRSKIGLITLGEFIHYIPARSGRRHLLEITEHLTTTQSIGYIKNRDLFKQRLDQAVLKTKTVHNEVILFSSLNNLDDSLILTDTLSKIGNVTILAPSLTPMPSHSNNILTLSKSLIDLRKLVINRHMLQKNIMIFEWLPSIPFDKSIGMWRIER